MTFILIKTKFILIKTKLSICENIFDTEIVDTTISVSKSKFVKNFYFKVFYKYLILE